MSKVSRRELKCSWCLRDFVSRVAQTSDGPWCSRHCMRIGRLVEEREARLPRNAALVVTASGSVLHPLDATECTTVGDFLVDLDDRLEELPPSPRLDALREHRDALFATWSAMTSTQTYQRSTRLEEVA